VPFPQAEISAAETRHTGHHHVDEYPNETFHRNIKETPGIRSRLRGTPIGIDVPTPDCRLFAGMYGPRIFSCRADGGPLDPDNAILIDAKGTAHRVRRFANQSYQAVKLPRLWYQDRNSHWTRSPGPCVTEPTLTFTIKGCLLSSRARRKARSILTHSKQVADER